MARPRLDPARLALARFGLGVSTALSDADLAAIGRDPKGALLAELNAPERPLGAEPVSSSEAGAQERAFQQQQNAERAANRMQGPPAPPTGPQVQGPPAPPPANPIQGLVQAELIARYGRASDPVIGIRERLVWFWSNHFCVSMDKGGLVRVIAGSYEREAIRRHVTGSFAAMLMATTRHPAMIAYLDNGRSIGPNSVAGRRQNRGLNENLAREILELHTLGVNGGYSQQDVTAFATMLTGWTIGQPNDPDAVPFRFRFNPRTHEPGPKTVLGRTYPEGEEGGLTLLGDLARHPATSLHIATKLVRHFVADQPPQALVSTVSKAFSASAGDLKATVRALVEAELSWTMPETKLRQPVEWVVALHRGLGLAPDIGRIQRALNVLGQPTWRVTSPKGFPDETAPWLDGLAQRVDVANLFARIVPAAQNPLAIAERLLGPSASPETRQAIRRAESPQQALTLALLSPEFLRR
ncbi:DUF1800 domain-containing protein [Phreatobacter aquaticus]|uniref:DUF1800 domain-containing protein n=1 Tax=Phreatobacter aquaticus TaxID=2570229 RepID=A0A4D7QT61_9HYPH|nr:DUF1800 domain-containing protein [Phreatobacter aquaticus]QCK88277.1 DUF1800 domain-containing protein [Phreatobacter aquaticus]